MDVPILFEFYFFLQLTDYVVVHLFLLRPFLVLTSSVIELRIPMEH